MNLKQVYKDTIEILPTGALVNVPIMEELLGGRCVKGRYCLAYLKKVF